MAQRRQEQAALSARSLLAVVAFAVLSGAPLAAGWPSLDAGSQLPSISNSATLREGFDMIAADPVDPQAVAPAAIPALSAVRNDPVVSNVLAATLGLSSPLGKAGERYLPTVVTSVGHFLLTHPRTRGAFDAIAASPTTGNILTSVSGWTPAVGGVITSSSRLMGDLFTFTGNGELNAAPPGRKLMQAAVVTPALVTGNPLVDGAAAVGQLVGPFLTSGLGAMSSLGTGLSDIASAALAGETALIVGKISPKAVAAVAAAVTIGQIVKEKIAIEAGAAAAATSSVAGAVYGGLESAAQGRRLLRDKGDCHWRSLPHFQ